MKLQVSKLVSASASFKDVIYLWTVFILQVAVNYLCTELHFLFLIFWLLKDIIVYTGLDFTCCFLGYSQVSVTIL